MSNRTLSLTDDLYEYMLSVSPPEDELLVRLREETARDDMSVMQISPEQGHLMSLLVSLCNARHALEIGTYTGYSSLCIARALPAGGKLITCDASAEWTATARRYWREAGLEERIELRLGDALDTLKGLLAAPENRGRFDFAFIDANKTAVREYYEDCLELLRPGGLIAVDNVLWGGKTAQEEFQDEDTRALREFNRFVKNDERAQICLVPISDGLTLARKIR